MNEKDNNYKEEEVNYQFKTASSEAVRAERIREQLGIDRKKKFLPYLLDLAELQIAKDDKNGNFKKDIEELQVHTSRIVAIYSNMVQRSQFLNDEVINKYEDMLEIEKNRISALTDDLAEKQEDLEKLASDKIKLESDLFNANETIKSQAQEILDFESDISELKDDKKNLKETVKKLEPFRDNYEKMKTELENQVTRLKSIADEYENSYEQEQNKNKLLEKDIENLKAAQTRLKEKQTSEIEHLKEQHSNEIKRLEKEHSDKLKEKDLEQREAILAAVQDQQAEYDKRIAAIYAQLNLERNKTNNEEGQQ